MVIKLEGPIDKLEPSERVEVQKYRSDLANAGLSSAEVAILVDDEVHLRLALKTSSGMSPRPEAGPVPPAHPPVETKPPSHGMGPYVKGLLAQGLRGRELADAIHAEQGRRGKAKGHGGANGAPGARSGTGGPVSPKENDADQGPPKHDGPPRKGAPGDQPGKPRPAPRADDPDVPERAEPPAKHDGPRSKRGGNANKGGGKHGKGEPDDDG